jgi:hypothetical protein
MFMVRPSHRPENRTGTSPSVRGRPSRTASLAVLALALAACSGGDGSSQAKHGTVVVTATSIAGTPISGVSAEIFDGTLRTEITDANGEARFADIRARDALVGLRAPGYYAPASKEIVVPADAVVNVPFNVVHKTEATLVLLGTHPVYRADGNKLAVDLDAALLDANGAPWETLTSADFEVGLDCGDGCYTWDVDGNTQSFEFSATVIDAALVPAPITPRPTIAAAVLLEPSAEMGAWDPDALRLKALANYFDSITAPDTVALGSYQGLPGTPALTTYGEFVADTGDLRTTLATLAGQELGTNALDAALADMISFTEASTAAGSPDLLRAIVTVRGGDYSYRDHDCGDVSCVQVRSAAEDAAIANGIAIVAIGPSTFYYPDSPNISRTGGAVARVDDPAQFPVVFRALNSIVGHHLAYTRVRIVLDTGAPDVWIPGRVVPIFLSIHLAADNTVPWYLEIPI